MNYLLRRPAVYLSVHWTVTIALAAALLIPRQGTSVQKSTRQITLLTGQVVTLGAGDTPQPAAGLLEDQAFGPDTYAYPLDATPQIGSLFDPQLFDISYLAAEGFDDATMNKIPVIVEFVDRPHAEAAVARGTIDGGIRLTHTFEYIPAAMGYVMKGGTAVPAGPAPTADGIQRISLDAVVREDMDSARDLVGVPAARARNLTGAGVKVAVLDTGIDTTHPDLKGRVVAAQDFSTDGDPRDLQGHGTHVAGIIAGSGALSDGKYGGIAPAVSLLNAKALNRNGSGSASGIIRAMEWAADNGAKVVNMSLGGGASDGRDAMSQEVNALTKKRGVLFVIAAGNDGPNGKVSTPAAADLSLAVGAVDKQKSLAVFSSRGPRTGDMAIKPDIVAPGVRITAPRANYGSNDPYLTISGTSMATPMVAGSAALVLQLHKNWTPQQVKDALMSSASPIGDTTAPSMSPWLAAIIAAKVLAPRSGEGQLATDSDSGTVAEPYVSVFDQGAGLVALGNLVNLVAIAEPASLSFNQGKAGQTAERSFVIQNISTQALHLTLMGTIRKAGGSAVNGLEYSPSTIDIPAGGSTKITARVTMPKDQGIYSGEIQLLSGEQQIAHVIAGFVVGK